MSTVEKNVKTDEPVEANDDEKDEFDRMLDEALRLTFPASDPIALQIERLGRGERQVRNCRANKKP